MLRDHGVDVTAIDVSRVGPERTRARGIDAIQIDLDTDEPPFADGTFDAVIANSNLEHLFYMRRHVARLARLVRPGGKFIWLVPNIGHWRYRLWLSAGRFPYIPDSPTDEYHIRYTTAHEGKKLLREAGLDGHPPSRPRRNVGPGPLSAPPREQVHEAVLRPAVRAPRQGEARSLRALPVFLRAQAWTTEPVRYNGYGDEASGARGEPAVKTETLTDPRRFRKRLRQKSNMAAKYVSYELELESAPTFPDRVYVESTNVCNLDCIMCPTGLHIDTRPKGYMEWDLYTQIIDEIAPFAEAVVLHSWGEPLLHQRILDMIRYAKERDVFVETSTNATLLDEETARKLIDSGLDRVYLSMDGLTKETYEKVRVKGHFETVRGNIERFLDLKHELGSPIEADIQIVRLSETDAEVDDFVKTWKASYAESDQHQGARHLGRSDRRGERARRRG